MHPTDAATLAAWCVVVDGKHPVGRTPGSGYTCGMGDLLSSCAGSILLDVVNVYQGVRYNETSTMC
jgi:hypothetical protein